MFSEEESLVGSIDNYGIVKFSAGFKVVEHASDAFIHAHEGSQIVLHVLLVLPTHQFLACEFS